MIDELADAALEVEGLASRLGPARVGEVEGQRWHEEGRLAQAIQELIGLERRPLGEDLAVGPVPDARAGDALGDLANDPQLAAGHERRERGVRRGLAGVGEDAGLTAVERHRPGLAVAVDLDVEPLRERIDHRSADAVQSTGCRVRSAAELAAGVELGEHDLDARETRLGLDVDGDAAGSVAHLDALVGVQDHRDLGTVTAQRLVDRVVDDLPEAMHEATGVGGTDVHTGTLANCLEPLEHGQMTGRVVSARHRWISLGRLQD